MRKFHQIYFALLVTLTGMDISGQSLYEDFSGYILPTDWSQSSVSPNDFWVFGGSVDFGTTSTIADPDGNVGEYTRIDFSTDPDTTALITPSRSISGITNPEFSFYYNSQTTSTYFTPYNRLIVDYWTGTSWSNILVIDSLTTAGWTKYTYDASLYTYSNDSVQFRFSAQEGGAAVGGTGTSTFDQDMAIDNVLIGIRQLCTSTSSTDTQTACDIYTWIDGNTYTTSNNSATHILTNASGCDSIVTLNLTINNATSGTDTQIACNTFIWIDGNTYTASNNSAIHTLTNTVGCDSIVTLNLTINNSTSRIDTQTANDSFTWMDGIIYTESNDTAKYVLTNSKGCDSTIYLNLNIIAYCKSRSKRSNFEWIKAIKLGDNFENISNTDSAGFGNYIDQILVTEPSDSLSIELTPGYKSRSYDEYWRIWVDMNNDGDFNDIGEKLFEQHGKNIISGKLVIPATIQTGNYRLRIAMGWKKYPSSCGSFTNGEVEEYQIQVN